MATDFDEEDQVIPTETGAMSIELKEMKGDGKRPLLEETVDAEEEGEDVTVDGEPSADDRFDIHAVGGEKKSTTFQSSLNTVKSIVGVGILSFPYALSKAGYAIGLPAILFIAVLVNYTMKLLVRVKEEVNLTRTENPMTNYEDISRDVMGKWGYALTVAAVMLTQIGIACAYVLFIAEQLHSLPGLSVLAVQLWALTLAPIFIALVLIRNIRQLAPFSALGLGSVAAAVSVVLFFGFAEHGAQMKLISPLPSDLFAFYGISVFAFEGINLAIPVHSNMEKPKQYGVMLDFSFLAIGSVFIVFALLGYSFFLDQTAPIIVLNLPTTGSLAWVVIVVKVALCVNVLLTFPMVVFPVISFLERLLFKREEHSCIAWRTKMFWQRNALRLGLVVAIIGVSVSLPYFEVVINLIGGVGNGTSGFIIPAALYLVAFKGRLPLWSVIMHWAILVFGVATAVLVTVTSIMSVVQSAHIPHNATSSEN